MNCPSCRFYSCDYPLSKRNQFTCSRFAFIGPLPLVISGGDL